VRSIITNSCFFSSYFTNSRHVVLIIVINYALISTDTPLAIDISCNNSIVLVDGSKISTNLLCLLISNCSLASLLTKVALLTVIFSILVGRGTGQTTFAPESLAIITIFLTASSNNL
jgi:hypothetical protein